MPEQLELRLTDNKIDKEISFDAQYKAINFTIACNKLNDAFCKSEINIISLAANTVSKPNGTEKIIDYKLAEDDKKALVTTYNYVGFYSTKVNGKDVSITITPRFGSAVQNRLFSHALGLYLPKGESSQKKTKQKNLWLIALMWKVNLEKALTKAQIPKTYKKLDKNQRYFRGRLKVHEHIRHNFVDESRFYCSYSKFSFDSPINGICQ